MSGIGVGSVVSTNVATVVQVTKTSSGSQVLSMDYKPPRGRRFLTVILGDVDMKSDGSEIDVDAVFNSFGYYKKED